MMNSIAPEHIIEAFSEVHNDNSIVESGHTFENHIDNSIIDSEALAKYMNNNIVGSVQTFENYIDNSILEPERTFVTLAEAHVTIDRYAAQTKAVVILSKTTKNSDNNDYRQALFHVKSKENTAERMMFIEQKELG
ncbi:2004_t:CDS:1, partial [Cetraspora pellucida]